MGLFDKIRVTVDALRAVRRPTVALAVAQARYDTMIQSLADALTAEFGLTWTVDSEAELDRSGRRWEYTTQRLTSRDRLDAFPDWSARYAAVVEKVAQVTGFGTFGYDPKESPRQPEQEPFNRHTYAVNDDVEVAFMSVDVADIGPSRTTRDAVGGDIEMDIDSNGTRILIAAAVPAANP